MNEIIKVSKAHFGAYSKLKKDATNKVVASIDSDEEFEKVSLNISWYCKNKRKDLDNIACGIKFILDGMVAKGTIKNDGWKQVAGFNHTFHIDKDNPRIEVEINEYT